jgi:hypothetical protein
MIARHALLTCTALLVACQNECQEICDRMATRAEECGITVAEDEINACVERMSDLGTTDEGGPSRADTVRVCRDYGDLETIRDEVTCEAIGEYWAAPAE